MVHASLVGLLTGLSLIAAIGAQNAYLLRQGLRRSYVGTVVVVCVVSDLLLISAGVSGIGLLLERAPWIGSAATWLGVAFLTWYGLLSAWRALRPSSGLDAGPGDERTARGPVVRKALALTWLNPHVYLDTVVLLGGIAAVHGTTGRWWFAGGAASASVLWFTALGFGARLLAPLLSTARAWRVVDLLVAATMLAIAAKLALS